LKGNWFLKPFCSSRQSCVRRPIGIEKGGGEKGIKIFLLVVSAFVFGKDAMDFLNRQVIYQLISRSIAKIYEFLGTEGLSLAWQSPYR